MTLSFARWRHEALHITLSTLQMAGRQLNPRPLRLAVEWGRGKVGAHVPKPQRLKRRSRSPWPCTTEDARRDWQTNRQTDRETFQVLRQWLESKSFLKRHKYSPHALVTVFKHVSTNRAAKALTLT